MSSKFSLSKSPLLKSLIILLFVITCSAQYAFAAQVQIAWNASADAAVTGYKVYHGTASRTYTSTLDAGTNLTYLISGISDAQPRYIAVTAYSASAESSFSDELTCYVVQAAAPTNGQILPAGNTAFAAGSNQTYSIVPSAGYVIQDVLVDGVSVGAVSSYTFSTLGACHTISAVFGTSQTYTITASVSGSGGGISPSGSVSVSSGTSKTFTITPSTNYKITDVKVDGTSVGAVSSYTFASVTANHTITASFELITYTITARVSGSGGGISPSGSVSVSSGTSKTFTITPSTNYKITDVKVDGTSVGAVSSYTFASVTANHTITASFELITYTITASVSGSGGGISPSGSVSVSSGTSKAFTITPSTNYKITDVKVDGTSVGAVSSYTFASVTANHTITASFELITYTITASVSGSGGGISPSGSVSVGYGTSKTFTITPSTNYKITDVKVDGSSVGAVSSYTFSSVSAAHTITASFELITYTITASVSGSGGSISPSGSVSVNSGASQAITITPSANYRISDVKVDGASVGAISSYTFSSVSAAHTITASFELITYTITASVSGSGGGISPSGSV
ncbi:MAG: hypothetical protein ABFD97_09880, partial [Syntrophobacter sp.]